MGQSHNNNNNNFLMHDYLGHLRKIPNKHQPLWLCLWKVRSQMTSSLTWTVTRSAHSRKQGSWLINSPTKSAPKGPSRALGLNTCLGGPDNRGQGFHCASFHHTPLDRQPWPWMMKHGRGCSKTAIWVPIHQACTSTDPAPWQNKLNITVRARPTCPDISPGGYGFSSNI